MAVHTSCMQRGADGSPMTGTLAAGLEDPEGNLFCVVDTTRGAA